METEERLTFKSYAMNVLNGLAIGTVVALIPGALLGELFKALLDVFPQGQLILNATSLADSSLGLVVGILIGLNFKFTPVQSASLGLATFFGGGVVAFSEGIMTIGGTGDVINIGITGAIGAAVILLIGDRLKAFTILLMPPILLLTAGTIGYLILPYVSSITGLIGLFIENLLTLQPMLMSMLIAVTFSVLIASPVTTVGVALAVSLAGIGSGAGAIGVASAALGYSILGWRVNELGVKLALFLGGPKLMMPNVFKNPKILIPVMSSAALGGALAPIFNIQGTPYSAGFGISGLVGPVNNLNLAPGGWTLMNILTTILVFIIGPVVFGLIFRYVYTKLIPIVSEEDYHLTVD